MILKKMEINNFRQFKGKHRIEFASSDYLQRKNVTILYGENGRGKTGIYRALLFCLYGDCRLSQDQISKGNEILLVNRHLLEEKPGVIIKASIEITFSHNQCLHKLNREISGIKNEKGDIKEQTSYINLKIQNNDGNTSSYESPQDINEKINEILDYRVREYFLFDGEKIERLTRASSEQRKEVSAGIRNLLNIDDLEKAIEAAGKLARELDKKVKDKSTGELRIVINDINDREDRIENANRNIFNYVNELEELSKEKYRIDEELKKFDAIRSLVEDRIKIERTLSDLDEELKELEIICRNQLSKTCFLIIKPTLEYVFQHIDSKREKGVIPPLFKSEFIQELLEKKQCICGRDILEGTEPFENLLEWMSKTPKSNETDAALEIWKVLNSILSNMDEDKNTSENYLQSYADKRDKSMQLKDYLQKISQKIGNEERKDAIYLNNIRKNFEADEIQISAKKVLEEKLIADYRKEIEILNKKRETLENDVSIRDFLLSRSKLARSVKMILKKTYNDYKKEVAIDIGKLATHIFKKLIDEEGGKNLTCIQVENDYSLQIKDQWGGKFLANISAGQRQIMSIAFIISLAKTASAKKTLEMPLFMDTPFGRLSQEHRNNLIQLLPTFSSQWILMATDTELGREEGQKLISGGKLGKFYRLKAESDGTTIIVEEKISDVPIILKAELEGVNND